MVANKDANALGSLGQSTQPKQLHLVAIGSSFASGPGIKPQIDRKAGRSARNYPHILAEKLNARLTDLTVSGATLKHMLDEPQSLPLKVKTFPPQLDGVPEDADIITITGGGNDLQYIIRLTHETLGGSMVGKAIRPLVHIPSEEPPSAEVISQSFVALIDAVHRKVPKAKIYLIEYFILFGPDVKSGKDVALSEERIRHYRGTEQVLIDAYRLTAEARPEVEVVPVAAESAKHGLGSERPWIVGLNVGKLFTGHVPYHPNVEGMEGVAELIYEKIQSGGRAEPLS